MTLTVLPNRTTTQWSAAREALRVSAERADHPLVSEHAATADRMLLDAGRPAAPWANRIAAIAVIAGRRADVAPTMDRRVAYLDVAADAAELLQLAEDLHGTMPSEAALALLDRSGTRMAALSS